MSLTLIKAVQSTCMSCLVRIMSIVFFFIFQLLCMFPDDTTLRIPTSQSEPISPNGTALSDEAYGTLKNSLTSRSYANALPDPEKELKDFRMPVLEENSSSGKTESTLGSTISVRRPQEVGHDANEMQPRRATRETGNSSPSHSATAAAAFPRGSRMAAIFNTSANDITNSQPTSYNQIEANHQGQNGGALYENNQTRDHYLHEAGSNNVAHLQNTSSNHYVNVFPEPVPCYPGTSQLPDLPHIPPLDPPNMDWPHHQETSQGNITSQHVGLPQARMPVGREEASNESGIGDENPLTYHLVPNAPPAISPNFSSPSHTSSSSTVTEPQRFKVPKHLEINQKVLQLLKFTKDVRTEASDEINGQHDGEASNGGNHTDRCFLERGPIKEETA